MAIVLVIDDHDATCRYIQHVCKGHGVECVTAQSAEAGMSLAYQYQPFLIFIDLRLPGETSGWDVIRQLRSDARLKESTVITISAGDHSDSAAEAGSHGYLRKPFTVQQIAHIIQQFHFT